MTNVPGITFGATGFQAPTESAILVGVQADLNAAFGGALNMAATTPQGQLSVSMAAIIGNVNDTFLYQSTQTDPAYAVGRWQDAIGRIYFMSRIPSTPTVITVACGGLLNTNIPVGTLLNDSAGNTYTCTGSGSIGLSGVVNLQFANLVPGPTAVPAAVSIYQAIPGLDSVTLLSGVIGQNVETRAAFEARREASVASNSAGSVASIRGAVLGVPGVIDAYVTENNLSTPVVVQGTLLAANSLYVAAVGGVAQQIGQAIWSKKAPGCNYNGNTTVTVQDSNSGYSPPLPSYSVSFMIPFNLQILFSVSMVSSNQVPSNAVTLVQEEIIDAFLGEIQGIPRASIGSTILAPNFVGPILNIGTWAQVRLIQVGSNNTPTATFNGSIGLNGSMTVTSMISGTIGVGNTLSGGSTSGSNVNITPGTVVVSQVSGSVGGSGVYLVSNPQLQSTGVIYAAAPTSSSVSVNINQEPVLSPFNISVVFS